MRGLERFERLSLNGWILGLSIDEILMPGGITLGGVGYYAIKTEFM
jgi:hypothetical protein